MIVLVKSNLLVKNIENKKLFNPFLPPKSPRFLLLVGYNIWPSGSSCNQSERRIDKRPLVGFYQKELAEEFQLGQVKK